LSNAKTAKLFYRTVRDPVCTKPPDFFALHVKVFIITCTQVTEDTVAALQACRNLNTLAIWTSTQNIAMRALLSSSLLSPRHLSIVAEMFYRHERHLAHPIFRNLTHLDIVWDDEKQWDLDALPQLESLTHLSLDIRFSPRPAQLIKRIASLSPASLRVLVLWIVSFHEFCDGHVHLADIKAICEGEVDPRAVIAYSGKIRADTGMHPEYAIMRSYEDMLYDWSGEQTFGNDLWALAEEKIEARRCLKEKGTRVSCRSARVDSNLIPCSLGSVTPIPFTAQVVESCPDVLWST
jgi:hypothetical protein